MLKKTAVFGLLLSFAINAFSFDYNKENFSLSLDIETGLYIYEDNVYIIGYEGKIWKDVRPVKLTDEHGYTSLKLKKNPYYGNGKEKTLYFFDLNGIIFHVPFTENRKPKESTIELFKNIYGGINKITASSELSEKTKSGEITYSVTNVLTLGSEKETGYFFLPSGCPWVPDISIDKEPYIDFELQNERSTIYILPGFVDFSRRHLWKQNARPKTIEVINMETSKSLGKFTIDDRIDFTGIALPESVKNVRIRFIDFYPGTKYQDPCVSSIYFGTDMWPYKGNHGKYTFEEGGYFFKLFNRQ